jgi:hypothetical protein
MGHKYDRGYEAGKRDAASHEKPRVDDHSWFGQGYRDGYLDERRREERGR